jgi:fucose 4-O-acetylase-like acetyltransferase
MVVGMLPTTPALTRPRPDSAPTSEGVAGLAAATPAGRDRYVDLLRGLAIAMVAIGHWLVVVPSYANGRFDGVNALATVPLMRWLSWLFQVMPLFFMVGGYANARSWRSAQRDGRTWSVWVRGRYERLLRPTLVFVGTWVVVAIGLRAVGIDPELVHTLAWLVVVPLWFLAVYVVVVAIAPPMHRLHQRFGLAVPTVLVVVAAAVDVARIHFGLDAVGYLNFLFVFGFCQQLGFFWVDGRLAARRGRPIIFLAAGLIGLWLLTHVGPYPVSMVGVPGEAIANNAPPTITFIALALAQAGLVMLVRRPVDRWLQRPRVWASVIGINAHAMTVHLWHFTALVVTAVVVLPLGVVPVFPEGSAAWWLTRVLALPVLSMPLVALALMFGRIERRSVASRPSARRPIDAVSTLLAVPCLAAAFACITIGGLSVVGAPAGVPLWATALMAAGLVLVRMGSTPARARVSRT